MKIKPHTDHSKCSFFGFSPLYFLFFFIIMCLQIYSLNLAETCGDIQKQKSYQTLYHPLFTPFFILMIMGLFLEFMGSHTPFFNKIGGSFLFCLLVPSFLVYCGLLPKTLVTNINYYFFYKPPQLNGIGINFAHFFITIVIIGVILGIERILLQRVLLKLILLTLITLMITALVVGTLGYFLDFQPPFRFHDHGAFRNSLFYIFVPLTSGGTNLGIIGLSQGVYQHKIGLSADDIRSVLLVPLIFARTLSFVLAGILYHLFDHRLKYSGQGTLELKAIPVPPLLKTKNALVLTYQDIGRGLLICFALYNLSSIVHNFMLYLCPNLKIETIHYLIIFLLIIKIFGLMSDQLESYAIKAGKFMTLNFTILFLTAVGITTKFEKLISCFYNWHLLLMVFVSLLTALSISFLLAKRFGFYNFESALTVGFGSHNSANIGIMTINNRVNLLAFAQITARVVGSLVYLLTIFTF